MLHLSFRIESPDFSYSLFVIQFELKPSRLVSKEPPIQEEYFLNLGAVTLTDDFQSLPTRDFNSDVNLFPIPLNCEEPPDKTTLPYNDFLGTSSFPHCFII